jgi:hypothetical protein
MKKVIHFLFATTLLMYWAGCSKDAAPTKTNSGTTTTTTKVDTGHASNSMRLTLDTTTLSLNVRYQTYGDTTVMFWCDSSNTDWKFRLGFRLKQLGSLPVGYGSYGYGIYSGGGSFAVHGIVTVTALSPVLTGTFNFTCVDSTKITNGSFAVPGF